MNFKKKQKGFTLIEIMLAILIFSILMISLSNIFVRSMSGYRAAKTIQKDLEDAQFIMNQMAKTLRTSSISIAPENSPVSSIVVFDYSQGKCFKYDILNGKIRIGSQDPPPAQSIEERAAFEKDTATWCSEHVPTDLSPMAAFYVENATPFFAVSSKPGSGSDGVLGKVTILLSICQNGSSCSKDRIRIQSSVSLRDYYKAGI